MADSSDPRPIGLQGPAVFRELAITTAATVASVAASPTITTGAGAPTATRPRGSVYLRTDGAADTTLYVNTDGGTTWTALTSS